MRVCLDATGDLYEAIGVNCNFIDRDGISQVFFKMSDGYTMVVDIPTYEYYRIILPRLLKQGYYRIPEFYKYDFVKQV